MDLGHLDDLFAPTGVGEWFQTVDEARMDVVRSLIAGPHWLIKRNDAAHTRRLVAELERLGHTVHLDLAA